MFSSDKVAPEGLGALALARRSFLVSESSSRLMIELTNSTCTGGVVQHCWCLQELKNGTEEGDLDIGYVR